MEVIVWEKGLEFFNFIGWDDCELELLMDFVFVCWFCKERGFDFWWGWISVVYCLVFIVLFVIYCFLFNVSV